MTMEPYFRFKSIKEYLEYCKSSWSSEIRIVNEGLYRRPDWRGVFTIKRELGDRF